MSRSVKKQSSTGGNRKLTTTEQLDREWHRVRRLREKNERLESEMQAFEQECIEAMRDAEREVVAATTRQTRHIAEFLTRKSLTQWQRVELIEWVGDNLADLESNPFCTPEVMAALAADLQAIGARVDNPMPADEDEPIRGDRFGESDDLFGDDSEPAADTDFDDDRFEQPEFEGFYDDYQSAEDRAAEAADRKRRQTLDQLLQGASIKTLFRHLTRQLHPDRETDPAKKRERDELMAQAAQARDSHDIFTLLAMYETHIGTSPFAILGEDEDKVLKLLKSQTDELKREQFDIRHATPFRSFAFDNFYDKKPAARDRKLNAHCKHAREAAAARERVTHSIRSIPTLRPYLEDRYDAAMIGYL